MGCLADFAGMVTGVVVVASRMVMRISGAVFQLFALIAISTGAFAALSRRWAGIWIWGTLDAGAAFRAEAARSTRGWLAAVGAAAAWVVSSAVSSSMKLRATASFMRRCGFKVGLLCGDDCCKRIVVGISQ